VKAIELPRRQTQTCMIYIISQTQTCIIYIIPWCTVVGAFEPWIQLIYHHYMFGHYMWFFDSFFLEPCMYHVMIPYRHLSAINMTISHLPEIESWIRKELSQSLGFRQFLWCYWEIKKSWYRWLHTTILENSGGWLQFSNSLFVLVLFIGSLFYLRFTVNEHDMLE